jgi:glutamyl-tRNA reductase
MELVVVGLSHKTAPLELREKLATPAEQVPERLRQILELPALHEAVLLSTCNRVEVFAAATDPRRVQGDLSRCLEEWAAADLSQHLYRYEGFEAVRHVFRVSSSLDSMVVGEPQILGQVKEAYSAATEIRATGPLLNRCLHRAFQVAKRVRSETGVARSAVSVSAIAVELARAIFDDLAKMGVLLLGAGEMAELAARHLKAAGVAHLTVANRSLERAAQIAHEVGGVAHRLEELGVLLERVDIVISSTATTQFLISLPEARRVLKVRKNRPIFFIDLGVPRNVDPRVGELDNVYLYDVDDLEAVAERNRAERRREAAAAEKIIEKETAQFVEWMHSLEVVPTLVALREKFVGVARSETARALAELGPADEKLRKAVERLGESIVNKLLHAPVTQLKRAGVEGGTDLAAVTRRLFELDAPEPPMAPPHEHAEPEKARDR